MGQNASRLRSIELNEPAGSQVSDNTAERLGFSDETAIASPRDKIDMDIYFRNSGCRTSRTPWFYLGNPAQPTVDKQQQKRMVETVPGGHQNRKRARSAKPL